MVQYQIKDVINVDFDPVKGIDNGILVPITQKYERTFFVYEASPFSVRGCHAHKECSQLLVAIKGTVLCWVDDACERKYIVLDKPYKGLFIPPTIWAEQIYTAKDAILLVMCSHLYNEDDYIRDYKEFTKFKNE